MARWLFNLAAAAAAFLSILMHGGCASSDSGYGASGYGLGSQVGSAVGAEVGGRHGYVGSAVGGAIGSGVEQGARQNQYDR